MDEKTLLTQDQVEKLVAALRTCRYELTTLAPRLTGTFQANANACVRIADEALRNAGRKP